MGPAKVECVANFYEGRDEKIVAGIADSIAQTPRVAVLGRTQDCDHNRAVITFAGAPDAIGDAAFRGIERAVDLIDLNRHQGVHPRLGAADVVPFVPIEGVTLEDCARIALEVGERVWRQLRVPVYFYEAAAKRPARVNLANVRRGGFEPMRDEIRINPERLPDMGTAELHPTAGACIIGARRLLIAFNINLATGNVEIARQIARKIRFSSGGLPGVKALGLFLPSRGLAQVSTNLTDFERTPPAVLFEAVRAEADRAGVGIVGSEIVGLIPRKALEMSAGCDMRLENFHPDVVLENQLAALLPGRR